MSGEGFFGCTRTPALPSTSLQAVAPGMGRNAESVTGAFRGAFTGVGVFSLVIRGTLWGGLSVRLGRIFDFQLSVLSLMYFLAESYLHQLDPFAIQFTDSFGIRWYGLSYAAGFLVGWWILKRLVRGGRSPLGEEQIGDFLFALILGVLVGGRLGYVFFYGLGEPLITFTGQFPYWEVLAINRGGMSSHGGMIGVLVACLWFGHKRGLPKLPLFDLTAFACLPGLCFGRLANFVNAELWGKALPESMQLNPPWWSVKYPQEMEGFTPDRVGELTAYYPSQIFQAITDGPVLLLVLGLVWLKPRKPGVIGAWFLMGYGALRISTEVFRQADEGVELILGLQRGQLLSALMILVGAVGLGLVVRRKEEPLGGLRPVVERGEG